MPLDVALLALIFYFAVRLKDRRIVALAFVQLASMAYLYLILRPGAEDLLIRLDSLSLVLLLISSILGPVVTIFAIGYMGEHEAHGGLPRSRQPRFFALLFLFLATMNAFAMVDNILWMYTLWEITTLCSFLLIAHDETELAWKNADTALWMNSLGGVAYMFGAMILTHNLGTVSLSDMVSRGPVAGLVASGVALLCLAGMTKAAQFPFQSWLLGAMVAPTPVSALLHSSTMVKAGVFLVVRLSPLYAGTILGQMVAVAGAFTFVSASALAIGQSNGKRVLAYSTIANLGLVISCAGIGTPLALTAAVFLIIYHAITKGLLFMCVGTIEQRIGSRDIEDMQGVFRLMPLTSVIMVLGMLSMLLPPFGVLMTKWLALEAAVRLPVGLVLIILGSAFTVVFWVQWIGNVLTMSHKRRRRIEDAMPSIRFSLVFMALLMIAGTAGVPVLYRNLVAPYLAGLNLASLGAALQSGGELVTGFSTLQGFMLVMALLSLVFYLFLRNRSARFEPPWVGGELANHDIRGIEFIGPGDRTEQIVVHSYYMEGVFSEKNLVIPASFVSILLIVTMLWVGF